MIDLAVLNPTLSHYPLASMLKRGSIVRTTSDWVVQILKNKNIVASYPKWADVWDTFYEKMKTLEWTHFYWTLNLIVTLLEISLPQEKVTQIKQKLAEENYIFLSSLTKIYELDPTAPILEVLSNEYLDDFLRASDHDFISKYL